MPPGLQIWGGRDQIIIDVTTSIPKKLGEIYFGIVSGSMRDSNLLMGSPWWIICPANTTVYMPQYYEQAYAYVEGDTIYYDFTNYGSFYGPRNRINSLLIYGVA